MLLQKSVGLRKSLYDPIPILKHGFVRLVDHMPKNIRSPLFCDKAIPEMARISYGEGTKKISTDKALIRYLLRNHHTSPFEAVEFKFHLKIPIFVERQLVRHRTASINQISGRYSVLPDEYYIPDVIRTQSTENKQGSEGCLEESNIDHSYVISIYKTFCENKKRHSFYRFLMDEYNVSREMARIILSQNLFTELYWKIDLHNLFNFLYLRKDKHAQEEIRVVADEIFKIVEKLCPVSTQAFIDYRVNSICLSAQEIEAIKEKDVHKIYSKREKKEFESKVDKLGLKDLIE